MTAIDYAAFRADIEDFARTACPAETRAAVAKRRKLGRAELAVWQHMLYERGWGAPNWPVEHGGTDWDWIQRHIFSETLAMHDCPIPYHHGIRQIGPVIIEFGSEAQEARFLPGILKGTDWWCQGYSEPGAGSDLASLKTRAHLEGDEYVVNGQKTWTSHAQESDWMYTLVRTNPSAAKQQEGISLLLIPMSAPGITVRPIRTIDGWSHVNEVFLDDVRVPASNLVGRQDEGWSYGKFLLERERLAGTNIAPIVRMLEQTRELVLNSMPAGSNHQRTLLLQLAELRAELKAIEVLGRRAIDAVMAGKPLGILPSTLKLITARAEQRITEVSAQVLGAQLMPRFRPVDGGPPAEDIEWLQNYLFCRVKTIYGGSSEVQKNVIARQLLGK